MSDDPDSARACLTRLDAARAFLEQASRREFAVELIVQGFDAVDRAEWAGVFAEAMAALEDASADELA